MKILVSRDRNIPSRILEEEKGDSVQLTMNLRKLYDTDLLFVVDGPDAILSRDGIFDTVVDAFEAGYASAMARVSIGNY